MLSQISGGGAFGDDGRESSFMAVWTDKEGIEFGD